MSSRQDELNGLLVVDKPGRARNPEHPTFGPASGVATQTQLPTENLPYTATPTSHDVVSCVRRWSGQRRIGHTGTLDPMASGVLVLCFGIATRLVEYYQAVQKRYAAEIVLGAATDTYDAMGAITATAEVPPLDAQGVESALAAFRGRVWQRPPVYSAIKQQGESLHHKARRGESVEVAPREVTFYEISLVAPPSGRRLQLSITCSAGTYIRSLAHDLGIALGTFGHLDVLRREGVGPFTLHDAHSLPTIEEAAVRGRLPELMLPLGTNLPFEIVTVSDDEARRLGFGQILPLGDSPSAPHCDLAQARTQDGRFAGIIRRLATAPAEPCLWKAEKWLL